MLEVFIFFTFETIESRSVFHTRIFKPVYGIDEDRMISTANGTVCRFLFLNKIIHDNNLICEQGDIIRRLGIVFREINNSIVRVGGSVKIGGEIDIIIIK